MYHAYEAAVSTYQNRFFEYFYPLSVIFLDYDYGRDNHARRTDSVGDKAFSRRVYTVQYCRLGDDDEAVNVFYVADYYDFLLFSEI